MLTSFLLPAVTVITMCHLWKMVCRFPIFPLVILWPTTFTGQMQPYQDWNQYEVALRRSLVPMHRVGYSTMFPKTDKFPLTRSLINSAWKATEEIPSTVSTPTLAENWVATGIIILADFTGLQMGPALRAMHSIMVAK